MNEDWMFSEFPKDIDTWKLCVERHIYVIELLLIAKLVFLSFALILFVLLVIK